MKPLAFSILVASISSTGVLSGCSSWPDQGIGGDAQVDTSHVYYIDQIDALIGERLDSKGAMETQWSIHNLKLDTLVLRGAQNCLPARVREAANMSKRARRELDGNLLEDARNSIVVLQKEVDEVERRLIYVKRHTECPAQIATYQQDYTNHETLKERYLKLKLKNLLNDPFGFDFDSDQVSALYREKLIVAARYLKQAVHINLIINGHADAKGDYDYNQELSLRRATAVRDILENAGLSRNRMQIRAFGEHLPIDTNQTASGRYMNRQVHVEFHDHHQESYDDLFFEMDKVFGVSETSSSKAMYLKHWREEIPNEH